MVLWIFFFLKIELALHLSLSYVHPSMVNEAVNVLLHFIKAFTTVTAP